MNKITKLMYGLSALMIASSIGIGTFNYHDLASKISMLSLVPVILGFMATAFQIGEEKTNEH